MKDQKRQHQETSEPTLSPKQKRKKAKKSKAVESSLDTAECTAGRTEAMPSEAVLNPPPEATSQPKLKQKKSKKKDEEASHKDVSADTHPKLKKQKHKKKDESESHDTTDVPVTVKPGASECQQEETSHTDISTDPPIKKDKKKKKSNKFQNKKPAVEDKTEAKTNIAETEAVSYLQKWKTDRDGWSFQKVRQVWLLQHMFESEKIDDDNFTVLLEYLEGLQGKAKETTLEKAQSTLESDETTDEKADRIRQVIQMLA